VQLQQQYLNLHSACRTVYLSRSVRAYSPREAEDEQLIVLLQESTGRLPGQVSNNYYKLTLRRRGQTMNFHQSCRTSLEYSPACDRMGSTSARQFVGLSMMPRVNSDP
jgi:hypothetical protein